MAHFWPDGYPIQVIPRPSGEPALAAWDGRRYRVREIVRRLRVEEGWWQEAVVRDYYKVRLDGGLLVVIFADRLTGRWYLQRLYL